jgi:hypothetical protein
MQDIPVKTVLQDGYLQVSFSPLVTHGFLDLVDLAAVAVAILRARPSKHARTRFELVGDIASYRDITQWLSEYAGMPITIERVDRDTAIQSQVHPVFERPQIQSGFERPQIHSGFGRPQMQSGLGRPQVYLGLERPPVYLGLQRPPVHSGLGCLKDAYGYDALARMISYYEEQYVGILLSIKHHTHEKNLIQWSDR